MPWSRPARLFWPSSEICSGRLRRSTMVSDCVHGVVAGRVQVVALADVETVLLTTSITRDFIVVTVIGAPSTVSVTVLCAATA